MAEHRDIPAQFRWAFDGPPDENVPQKYQRLKGRYKQYVETFITSHPELVDLENIRVAQEAFAKWMFGQCIYLALDEVFAFVVQVMVRLVVMEEAAVPLGQQMAKRKFGTLPPGLVGPGMRTLCSNLFNCAYDEEFDLWFKKHFKDDHEAEDRDRDDRHTDAFDGVSDEELDSLLVEHLDELD